MRVATRLLLALLVAAVAGCGKDDRSIDAWFKDLGSEDKDVTEKAVQGLGRAARKRPDLVRRLVDALETERADPLLDSVRFLVDLSGVPESDARAIVEREVARVFQSRLTATRYPALSIDLRGGGEVVVRVPRAPEGVDAKSRHSDLIDLLTRPGGVELLAVVPSPAAGAPSSEPWADAAAYEDFARRDAARYAESRKSGAAYVPLQPGYRGREAVVGSGRFVVLREPEPGKRFDERNLVVVPDVRPGRPAAVHFQVEVPRQDEFEAWTRSLVGGEIALVVDGYVVATWKLTEPARVVLTRPLGPPSREAEEWAGAVARMAEGGRLSWPIRGEVMAPGQGKVGTPVARALVVAGADALPLLEAYERRGGPALAAARWAHDQILRAHTRPSGP